MSLTPEQQAIRDTGIGASEIGAVCGLSPYAGPLDVYLRKVEGFAATETTAMRRGTALEPVILAAYEEETGLVVTSPRVRWEHGVCRGTPAIVLASPDGVVESEAGTWLVEAKSVNLRSLSLWGDTSGPESAPSWYVAQCQWQMAATGLQRVDLAALMPDDELRVFRIPRHDRLIGVLVERAERFWRDHVVARVPPPFDAHSGPAEYVKKLYARNDGTALEEIPDELRIACRRYADAHEAVSFAEERKTAAQTAIRALLGEHDRAKFDGWSITCRAGSRTDWQSIARKLGATEADIAAAQKPTDRQLRVSVPKSR